ncbi:shikimate dehydrogenase [Ornithinibacillus halotolerans]|uniref:Shikimate dehydrogenase (NADP(+)) n=1 Tax=Ornithinibacillus halotolerans TaxID=1274357 RepID=A0A916RVY8_9BACI|nr:shikimate dehydrogenase [Ornithinibacillus halotolerans]GGA68914.1 shikimate dehydrogenase (NADP(+)) [Ornithinibacillus halotolerans]
MEYKLGLLGYPISHSLSPWIYNQFLKQEKIKGTYTIFEVEENRLIDQVNKMKEKNFNGFNVTAPYKEKIIPLLDELDVSAQNIGAVNTVLIKNGQLTGYNTDAVGYLRSLEQYFPHLKQDKQQKILIIGAGGAARAIYYGLNRAGYISIDLTNRTLEKAHAITKIKSVETKSSVMSLEVAEKQLKEYDLVIQTTSVGMKPRLNEIPITLDGIRSRTIVSDIIYQPIWTKFLTEAKALNASIHHGHTMLLYQAQYAFEIWFGKKPTLKQMDEQLKRILEG